MKMKLKDRVLVRLGALITLCAGAVSVTGGVLLHGIALGESLVMQSIPVALLAGGCLTVIVSLFDLLLPRRYAPHYRAFVVQPTEHGELRIAVSALENLILKCVETHKEVKVLDMSISNRRGAVAVDLHLSMNSNVSIPHAVEQMQTQIKRYLAASSGIEVRDISVSVERASGDAAALPREPLPSAEVIAEEAAAEPEAKSKEKVPMHQRIFGRDPKKTESEQVTEAEMVEAPVQEIAEQPAAQAETDTAADASAEEAEPAEEAADTQAADESDAEEQQ